MKLRKILLGFLLAAACLPAQTIEEKKLALQEKGGAIAENLDAELVEVNREGREIRQRLTVIRDEVERLHARGATPDAFQAYSREAAILRTRLKEIESAWRTSASQQSAAEPYALWYQPESTVEQLVMDYGAQEYVYLMDPEIALRKLTIASNLAIPNESWTEMLEWILGQNGIGFRQVNPYLRVLYLLKEDLSQLATVTNSRADLDLYGQGERIGFVVDADPTEAPRLYTLLEKFAHPDRVSLKLVGGQLFLVGRISDLKEVLKVSDFVQTHTGPREYRLVTLDRLSGEEMGNLLSTIFDEKKEETSDNLLVLPLKGLPQSLFLLGSRHSINRAEDVIAELESQLSGAQELTVFRYRSKHTEAEELAEVLEKVYRLLIDNQIGGDTSEASALPTEAPSSKKQDPHDDGVSIVIKPQTVDPSRPADKKKASNRTNFIVDKKTGSIIMVVRPIALVRLKELIRKLDVPKKMVRIEVLLFEKFHSEQNDFGLNLLKLGDKASQGHVHGSCWNETTSSGTGSGILEYMFSRGKSGAFPAFDLTYRMLLGQENVQINASPSVVTVNQTTASIKLVEEISLNTGVVELDTSNGTGNLKDSFVRAQYGIIIEVTPTIHIADEEGQGSSVFDNYITLDTDIVFDSTQPSADNRPNVTRRNIKNQVRIADGETVILGGLRQKRARDTKNSIPFLGEIPGFGKLFSDSTNSESETELFIMLTPKIISDPLTDFARSRQEEMKKRPGDLPEFLDRLVEARDKERTRLFKQSMKVLLSQGSSQSGPYGEYNGRG